MRGDHAIRALGNHIQFAGNQNLRQTPCLAIVGSRHASEQAKSDVVDYVTVAMKYDLTIVSGLAKGIDAVAHKSALQLGLKTISCLPSNLLNIYPKENEQLAINILNCDGLLMSVTSDDKTMHKGSFIQRNRLIADISHLVIIAEATETSGTRHVARAALEYGKPVFFPERISEVKWIKHYIQSRPDIFNTFSDLGELKEIFNDTKEGFFGIDEG